MSAVRPVHGAAVIIAHRGEVLAISKGTDLAHWELPGGRLEPGESFEQAAARELAEETGVRLDWQTLRPVMRGPTRSGGEHMIFLASQVWLPPVLESVPFEGYVAWKAPAELLGPRCTHATTNRIALARVGLL